MSERGKELARRRRRKTKVAKLMRRLNAARTREEREWAVTKLTKLAPWRYQEFRVLLS